MPSLVNCTANHSVERLGLSVSAQLALVALESIDLKFHPSIESAVQIEQVTPHIT
jgi:hypothetical protein